MTKNKHKTTRFNKEETKAFLALEALLFLDLKPDDSLYFLSILFPKYSEICQAIKEL